MKKNSGGFYFAFIALLVSLSTFYMFFRNNHKIGFVLISDVYNEFDLKKEMETKYNATRSARKKILDSLQIDLSVLSNRLKNKIEKEGDKELFERKRIEYNQKAQLFDEDNTAVSRQFDEQIIKQLNQYIADFGKEKNYDIIYGNTTNGSIMYGTDQLNITKEVTNYINAKYKGAK